MIGYRETGVKSVDTAIYEERIDKKGTPLQGATPAITANMVKLSIALHQFGIDRLDSYNIAKGYSHNYELPTLNMIFLAGAIYYAQDRFSNIQEFTTIDEGKMDQIVETTRLLTQKGTFSVAPTKKQEIENKILKDKIRLNFIKYIRYYLQNKSSQQKIFKQ